MVSIKVVCAAALFCSTIAAQNSTASAAKGALADTGRENANAKDSKATHTVATAGTVGNEKDQPQNSQPKNNQPQTGQAQDNRAQNNRVQNSQAQSSQTQENKAQDNQAQDNQVQDNRSQNNQPQKSQAQDNQAQSDQTNPAQNGAEKDSADSTALAANAIQTGSFFDGQDAVGAADTQATSRTSQNNFINDCEGKPLTNGLQLIGGSCNGIVMGELPAKSKMVSCIILFPRAGQDIPAGEDFNITLQVNNLQAGSFTNAVVTYYAAPQQLNSEGTIIGHTHVTVQDLGNSLSPQAPPDPTRFAFFKGIDDDGNGQGRLQATVPGGLPEGNYRVCTLSAASNHQPVVMPVAQRGSQDDCTKFTVSGARTADDGTAGNGNKRLRV